MFVSRQLKEKNIAEYLIYMWQIEDLIRANGCDMEQGKIAESGTHEQLMAQNKAYAALFNKQQELEHFREEAV